VDEPGVNSGSFRNQRTANVGAGPYISDEKLHVAGGESMTNQQEMDGKPTPTYDMR